MTCRCYSGYVLQIWRRSYDTPPPALEPSDDRWSAKEVKYGVSKILHCSSF